MQDKPFDVKTQAMCSLEVGQAPRQTAYMMCYISLPVKKRKAPESSLWNMPSWIEHHLVHVGSS